MPQRAEGALIEAARGRAPVGIEALLAPGGGGVVAIAPHPDDETLGCGLALAAALRAGRRVGVALLTGGGNSHPRSRSHPPERMVALRRAEFDRAVEALARGAGGGPIETLKLDLPDGAAGESPARMDEAARAVCRFAGALGAETLWTTWGGDPHADHVAASRIAARAVALAGREGRALHRLDYAVWGRFGARAPARVLPFDAPALRPAKRRAMDAHASQLTPLIPDDPEGFVMPASLTEHFARHPEIFVPPEEP